MGNRGAQFMMLAYLIPVVIVTLLFVLYGILNVEDGESSPGQSSGCEGCSQKDSCSSGGYDDFVHFAIHKPEMKPSPEIFSKKKDRD